MSFHVTRDSKTNASKTIASLSIPEVSLVQPAGPPAPSSGSIILNSADQSLYYGNGSAWVAVATFGSGAVPLGSISTAGLINGALSANVLGATTVSTAGATSIAGDLILYPGTSITGPFAVSGVTINSGTSVAAAAVGLAAQNDLTAAYINAQSRTGGILVSDLSGTTLTPGVYKSASSLLNSGVATLNAMGNPNAVWIFQVGSSLTTATGSSLVLINGAHSANVFWQIGSSATFGTGSSFSGIVMAQSSITFSGNNTFQGRALARTGAVTFAGAASTVTLPV